MKSFQQFMKEFVSKDDAVDSVEKKKLDALVSRKELNQKKEEDQEDAETKQDGQLNKQEIEVLKKRVKNLEDNS